MNKLLRPLTCFLALAVLAGLSRDATALARHKQIQHAKKAHAPNGASRHAALKKGKHSAHATAARRKPALSGDGPPKAAAVSLLSGDIAAVKQAIDLARKAKTGEATAIKNTIGDPAAQKLVEWYILRHPDADAKFSRYAAFIADNPDWPSRGLMRRRAEARLWREQSDAATVHSFTGDHPASGRGRFALARVLLAEGDRDGAGRQVREAWRSEELSERSKPRRSRCSTIFSRARTIGHAWTGASAPRIFQEPSAQRSTLGSDDLSIVKACAAVAANATKALDRLDGVATEARQDLGYALCRIHWMLRHDRIEDATRLMLAAAPQTMAFQDTDEWWRERRVLARKLLDLGKFEPAYQVVRDAALPASENYRADFHFMTGWIALRYLHDPASARAHFAHIDDGSSNPIVLARANYWRGRAAEAIGEKDAMRASYEAAARHTTAYYGQLARAKLGLDRD